MSLSRWHFLGKKKNKFSEIWLHRLSIKSRQTRIERQLQSIHRSNAFFPPKSLDKFSETHSYAVCTYFIFLSACLFSFSLCNVFVDFAEIRLLLRCWVEHCNSFLKTFFYVLCLILIEIYSSFQFFGFFFGFLLKETIWNKQDGFLNKSCCFWNTRSFTLWKWSFQENNNLFGTVCLEIRC